MSARNSRIRFIAGVAAGALACAAMSTDARADATIQAGNATITAGVGTAILTLPEIQFVKIRQGTGGGGHRPGEEFGRLR